MPGVDRLRATAPGGLSWGLRFEGPHDPETLIALDLAEALDKARERAYACRCSASLWRDGRRVAEIPPGAARLATPSRELIETLANAGWYIVGVPDETGAAPGAPSAPLQADRIESR